VKGHLENFRTLPHTPDHHHKKRFIFLFFILILLTGVGVDAILGVMKKSSLKLSERLLLPTSCPNDVPLPTSLSWYHADTPELYAQSLIQAPTDWRYRDAAIRYDFNTEGYRAPEWNTVDWHSVDVILGCSHVMGQANADEHTIGAYISELTGRSVINLGSCGAGPDWVFLNALRVARVTLGRIYVLWPSAARFYFMCGGRPSVYKTADILRSDPDHMCIKHYLEDEHWHHRVCEYHAHLTHLLGDRYVHSFYATRNIGGFESVSEWQPLRDRIVLFLDSVGRDPYRACARDLDHWSPEINRMVALHLVDLTGSAAVVL
jgi:hypothetical protein